MPQTSSPPQEIDTPIVGGRSTAVSIREDSPLAQYLPDGWLICDDALYVLKCDRQTFILHDDFDLLYWVERRLFFAVFYEREAVDVMLHPCVSNGTIAQDAPTYTTIQEILAAMSNSTTSSGSQVMTPDLAASAIGEKLAATQSSDRPRVVGEITPEFLAEEFPTFVVETTVKMLADSDFHSACPVDTLEERLRGDLQQMLGACPPIVERILFESPEFASKLDRWGLEWKGGALQSVESDEGSETPVQIDGLR